MASPVLRADRATGEVGDWVRLLATILDTERQGVVLSGNLLAVLVSGICRASAVTLGSRVLFSRSGWTEIGRGSDAGLVLLAHELVHVRQYRQLGFARFLRAYCREYLSGRLRGRSHRMAYREISFEREARRCERFARQLLERGALLRGDRPPPTSTTE